MNNNLNEAAISNGIYSLYNGWIKEPVKDNIPDVDQSEIDDKVEPYVKRAKNCNTIEDIDSLIDDLYLLRQESIIKDGEFGEGNLIFKEMRNRGYLQALKDKKVELENKDMSLESLKESKVINLFLEVDSIDDKVNDELLTVDSVKELIDNLEGDAISVELYDSSNGHNYAAEYIIDLSKSNKKLCGKLLHSITVFKIKGTQCREPITKPLRDGIYEIRAQQSSNITRVLFFFVIGNRAIITNGFTKKTEETPKNEIQKAINLRNEYYENGGK